MADTTALRFSCDSCKKSYGFKPELANKKVKCKCGAVIVVPDLSSQVEEDMYDIKDEPKQPVKVAKPARTTGNPQVAAQSNRPGTVPTLGYQRGPTANDRKKGDSIYDYTRDFYVPGGLIAVSFVILIGCIMGGVVRGGSPFSIAMSFTILSLINTALMIGGALFIGGKVGISFGEPLTAVLKFIAIALFVGVITTIIDEKFGMLGICVLSLAASAILYTGLFIYLFSMDAEDSIWMVCFFIGIRTALSWLLLPILLGFFGGGGLASIGGGMGAGGGATVTTAQQELIDEVENAKELGLLEEAVEFIKGGRQSYWLDGVNAAYAAGAKYVGFTVAKDFNGKPTATSIIIEMPSDPQKRSAIVKAINDFRTATYNKDLGPVPVLVDIGGQYLEIPVRG